MVRKPRRFYNAVLNGVFGHPVPRMTLLSISIMHGVLDALEPALGGGWLKAAREKWGYNKKSGVDLKKQAFWNSKILSLVDQIKPLCVWRKGEWGKVGGSHPKVRDRTIKFVSRFLHACYPDVWPDDYKLIGKRYRDATERQKT